MKRFDKLRYMALGAGILALGITIGQFITPNIKAQNNGVFDKITCRKIEVVDESGKVMAGMGTNDNGGTVSVFGKDGKPRASIGTTKHGGNISVSGMDNKGGILIYITEHGGHVNVFDKDGGSARMTIDEHGGRVVVFNKQGKSRAVMGVNKNGNGGFTSWDKDDNHHNVR